jgi:flavin reductase (DIM6/NTAB) family NADH-FMN oxidoreductase RutF
MQPKRYCIAVYRGTQTHKNIYGTHTPFLLQSLTEAQAPLVRVLGKKSGTIYNKARYLTKKATKNIQAVPLAYHGSLAYLAESAFVLECIPEQYIDVGDHDLVIARVDTVLRNTPAQLLTTQYLQDTGLIL